MKWKRITWDCPFCNYALWIYTDSKGNVKRIRKAEAEIKKRKKCN